MKQPDEILRERTPEELEKLALIRLIFLGVAIFLTPLCIATPGLGWFAGWLLWLNVYRSFKGGGHWKGL